MNIKSTFVLLLLIATTSLLPAQTAKDATVPITATISTSPASITLNWTNPSVSGLLVQRRVKGQSGFLWTTLINEVNSVQSSLIDTDVTVGQTYEYYVKRTSNVVAHGYAQVALEAPVTDNRGELILFVDADIVAPLAPELERLRDDLVGDGWQIIEHVTDTSATVQSIKNQILTDFNAPSSNVKSVFLLGKIPIPYSGNSNWDGHPDHAGAWPCDAYYAELNGTWTDESVYNITPSRDANDNVPGDGKFDQSTIPTSVELQVGRVDFRRLTEGTFGATTVELLRRYLDKDHNWRTGAYTVENKALVDDNFGYFSGEAFAASGYRNAYPLVGEANIVSADFFNDTNPQTYLMGYGCGGGTYTSASGVGNSTNFATDTVNIVFSSLFGSYHGDWDYETNPFMPSALASRGGILTCSWAGRPHHFYQALASGETAGYCMKETQNALYNNGYFPSIVGEGGAHTALLGDPTVRAHIVAPVAAVTATSGCGKVTLEWAASTDTAVEGYLVYRSQSRYGAYTRLTASAINETFFTDENPAGGTLYYQVKAVKLQTSPGGGAYWNTSTGAMISVVNAPALTADYDPAIIDCDGIVTISVTVSGGTPPFQYLWSNGETTPVAHYQNGLISVTVTDANGCTLPMPEIFIAPPLPLTIDANITNASASGASDGSADLTLDGGNPPFTFLWSNGATTEDIANITGGTYLVTITDAAGCTTVATIVVGVTSNIDEAAIFQQLLLSPNPNEGVATLSIKMHNGAPVRVIVHDATGRMILEKPEVTASELSPPIDLHEYPPGVYTIFIFVEKQAFARKMVVSR